MTLSENAYTSRNHGRLEWRQFTTPPGVEQDKLCCKSLCASL